MNPTTGEPRDPAVKYVPPRRASRLKRTAKSVVRAAALVAVFPVVVVYRLNALLFGPDRALEGASQLLSLFPGLPGQYLRVAFLRCVLARCHPSAHVEFGTILSQAGTRMDENVYVGPRCVLGYVHLEHDALLAGGVQVPSGGMTHYFEDPTRPIREQGGERRRVTIGAGAWVGSGAVVLADVGAGTIVAAGAVVTRPLPANVIAAGVPAKVIRGRFDPPGPPAS